VGQTQLDEPVGLELVDGHAVEEDLAPAGDRMPEMVRMVVDLPAPLAPIMATISPSPTRKDTSQMTWTSP
jgi:hypothetical protein